MLNRLIKCAYWLIVLLNGVFVIGVPLHQSEPCDWDLRDSPKDGKVVHTFHSRCSSGQIKWFNPFGGMELTFTHTHQDISPGSFHDKHESVDDLNYNTKLQFCYAIRVSNASVKVLREEDGNHFYDTKQETCIAGKNHVKIYGESFPTTISNIFGKFKLNYLWTLMTPYEGCSKCTHKELSFAACTSQYVFTGSFSKTSTRHNNNKKRNYIEINLRRGIRFRKHDTLHHFCHGSNKRGSRNFRGRNCDKLKIDNQNCYRDNYVLNKYSDLIFFADVKLYRLSVNCALPYEEFLSFWENLLSEEKNECLLDI